MMQAAAQNQGEILIVEDTPASLKLLTDLLQGAGYLVRQAPDGELALWSAQSRPPELILLDIRMPGIDGFEVCRQLKLAPALRDIPVIFLSAQYDTDDKLRGFQAGAVDFIPKPYQAEEVLARARAHIGLARSQRALAAANADLTATLAQLRTARAEIRRSERLAALGALVAGVAHELNTPIGNSVLAASTLVERSRRFGAALDAGLRRSDLQTYADEAIHGSELMLRNLERAAGLVNSFKQVAADQSSAQRRRFDLARLIEDMSVTLAPSLREAGVALAVTVAPEVAMDTFPGTLCQIYSELALNAMRHGLDGVTGAAIKVEAGIEPDGMAFLAVSDNGGGIASAHIDKIFDPFFTTRLGQGSSGLGLNVVHNLVANVLGGSIEVASAPGHTRFVLRFPPCAPTLAVAADQAVAQ